MTEPTTTFVSVDRGKLKEDRASGSRQRVIRVQQGSRTQFGTEAEILGPSRVRYHLDPPPGVPNVWVETTSEVRVGDGEAPARTPPVIGPPTRPRPLLSQLLQTDLLGRAIAKLQADAADEPPRPDLLRRLGDLQRQTGDWTGALATYERLLAVAPADPVAARLTALLRGEMAAVVPWPEPFSITRDLLPPDRLDQLLAFTARHESAFEPTSVTYQGRNAIDSNQRWCTNIWGISEVAEFINPLIEAQLPRGFAQLGLPPERLELRDSKITHYGDGGFFGPHVDRGPGVETRVAGFILYFYFPPKRYAGGGLAIYDRNLATGQPTTSCTTIVPEQNQLVLVTATCWHEVLPVRCPPDQWDAGRFTFSGWVCRV